MDHPYLQSISPSSQCPLALSPQRFKGLLGQRAVDRCQLDFPPAWAPSLGQMPVGCEPAASAVDAQGPPHIPSSLRCFRPEKH